jgi:hypothetical protein
MDMMKSGHLLGSELVRAVSPYSVERVLRLRDGILVPKLRDGQVEADAERDGLSAVLKPMNAERA